MKKLTILLLALCLCISTTFMLASCSGGDPETTVTKDAWNEALAKSNFTVNGFITERDIQESVMMEITEKHIHTENDGYTMYVTEKDGAWYVTNDGVQVGSVVKGVEASVRFAMRFFSAPEYESFVYDEATKSYLYVKESAEASGFYQINVYFEDGIIVKIEGKEDEGDISHSFTFTDYGSTVVEFPAN